MKKLTKTYNLYEVIKVPFPFTDTVTTKIRPALILSSAKYFNSRTGLSIMAMITSKSINKQLWPTDVTIEDLDSAGLPFPSLIRFKLFTLDHRLILGRIGQLSEKDQKQVCKKLKEVLAL